MKKQVLQTVGLMVYKESSSESSSDFSYQISSGNDKDLFTLNSSTGKLSLATAPVFSSPTDADKNNIYEISIKSNS
jgi:hypothetical protein